MLLPDTRVRKRGRQHHSGRANKTRPRAIWRVVVTARWRQAHQLPVNGGIRILDVEVGSRDVAQYLRSLPKEQHERAVAHAVEVGVFCLERAQAGQSLEFVKREVDGLLNGVKHALEKLPNETQAQIAAKIGTGDGQVLAPIQSLVTDVSRAASGKLEEIRGLLQNDIDPKNQKSTIGEALQKVRDLLDPKNTDSVQAALNAAVNTVTTESGPLAKAIREVVRTTLGPLEKEVSDLAKAVRVKEGLEQIPQNIGDDYEDAVVRDLQGWAKGLDAEVHHVGPDHRPGDVLVILNESPMPGVALRIITEARDRQDQVGRKVISDTLKDAMAERTANAAVFVSKTRAGLGREIGDWAEGTNERGRWVACIHEHLITAIRFLWVQERLQQVRAATPSLDASGIANQIQRIKTALARITNIKTKVTAVRDEIEREADALREDIRSALNEVEDGLRSAGKAPLPK